MIPKVIFATPVLAALILGVSIHAQDMSTEKFSTRQVVPTVADPTLKTEFDDSNFIYIPSGKQHPELVVWLPGTHGKPGGESPILKMLASSGYRVIGLMYNDVPTGESLCAKNDSLTCGGSFREERVEGDATDSPIQNTVQESISHRLVSLLKYESKAYPKEGWDAYLTGDQPNWSKIIISGHSQGAGHAAYIAKRHEVARVVLLSGGPSGTKTSPPKVSDWVVEPSKTPADRWWAEFHEKEAIAPYMPMAYDQLGIPKDHILVFHLEPLPGAHLTGPVAYHMTVIQNPAYLPQWAKMYGVGAQ
jgi:hypothetical protein